VDWGNRTIMLETNNLSSSDYTIDKHVVLGMAESLDLPG
jgi:hypothetical protein